MSHIYRIYCRPNPDLGFTWSISHNSYMTLRRVIITPISQKWKLMLTVVDTNSPDMQAILLFLWLSQLGIGSAVVTNNGIPGDGWSKGLPVAPARFCRCGGPISAAKPFWNMWPPKSGTGAEGATHSPKLLPLSAGVPHSHLVTGHSTS